MIGAVRWARSPEGLAGILAVALAGVAYRPLAASALLLPTRYQLETWLFRPGQLPLAFALGLAGWLLWHRRARLRTPGADSRPILAAALALAASALFVWAHLTASAALLLPSLAAAWLACATALRGKPGARAVMMPALVLLLGVPIPAPLRHEIVWRLQLATARSAAWLLDLVGRDFTREGVTLHDAAHTFHVIDGCSGLQGIATLFGVAVIVRELLGTERLRAALLFASSVALGHALNAVRIAYVAAGPTPDAFASFEGDHTPQGLAVLAAGTASLYALGSVLARGRGAPDPRSASPCGAQPAAPGRVRWLPAAGFGALALLSLALSPFAAEPPALRLAFPEAGAGWSSEPMVADPYFLSASGNAPRLHRRYRLAAASDPSRGVEVFVAVEAPNTPEAADLLSSKTVWPGPEWDLRARERARIWTLGIDAEYAVASRGDAPERAVIYSWRIRDEGLVRESIRALFALDASPLRRAAPRKVVRLVAVAPFDEPLAIGRAKRRMDAFITDFREPLETL